VEILSRNKELQSGLLRMPERGIKKNGGAGRSSSLAVAGYGCCRHGASGRKKPGRQSYGIDLAQTTQCETPVNAGRRILCHVRRMLGLVEISPAELSVGDQVRQP